MTPKRACRNFHMSTPNFHKWEAYVPNTLSIIIPASLTTMAHLIHGCQNEELLCELSNIMKHFAMKYSRESLPCSSLIERLVSFRLQNFCNPPWHGSSNLPFRYSSPGALLKLKFDKLRCKDSY